VTDRSILVAPGELRADLFELFDAERDECTFVSSAPGLLPAAFEGQAALAHRPYELLSAEQAGAHRARLLEFLASEVDRLPFTAAWWERIQRWLDSVRSGAATFRYLPRRPVYGRLVSRPDASFVPGGPLAGEGAELMLRLSGAAHADARTWILGLLEESDDISADVEGILRHSWGGDALTPRNLYYKILAEYFEPMLGEMDVDVDDNPVVEQLTAFQRSAYQAAKGILRRYGGVFLADVVGLGKTYIAIALLAWLERTLEQHAVVIAPPALLGEWGRLRSEYNLTFELVSIGKLDDLQLHTNKEVVVIDESHNFRNAGTQRYGALEAWLRPDGMSTRKVLLLSATPQNNEARDVREQLRLFPDDHSPLPFVGETRDDFFRKVANGERSLSQLLTHVLVRRTRQFIKDTYPNATIRRPLANGRHVEVPLEFPRRVSGEAQCLRYRIDDAYGGRLYDDVLSTIGRLKFPLQALSAYVEEQHAGDPRLSGLRRAGTSVRGLYRILLFKRLESSVEALRCSLDRLERRLRGAEEDLARGVVRVKLEIDAYDEEAVEESEVEAWHFDISRLQRDLRQDLELVRGLRASVDRGLGADAKLTRLAAYFADRPPTRHRTIVFTQFADTAHYLGDQLGQVHGRCEVVSGRSGNVIQAAKRFAPKAMRAETPDEVVDLLIATDVLSEGVNLQDADTLINYDLHWNPVRLIQRAGRIDRIGSEHDEIHIASFLPERQLEENLNIERIVRRRIDDFLAVFGGDSRELPSDERPDVDGAVGAYTGEAFAQAERQDETDGMSRHFERLNAVRRDEPDLFEQLRRMRPGRHATSTDAAPTVAACRLAWHWAFYRWDEPGQPTILDDLKGLDALYQHAQADEAPTFDFTRFTALADQAVTRFAPDALSFRQQRERPRLVPAEQHILRLLDEYALVSPSSRVTVIDQVRRWLLGGQYKLQVQRLGRNWMRQRASPAVVFQELTVLMRRYPVREESLGEPILCGIMLGAPPST
jgi:hypothetical protein